MALVAWVTRDYISWAEGGPPAVLQTYMQHGKQIRHRITKALKAPKTVKVSKAVELKAPKVYKFDDTL